MIHFITYSNELYSETREFCAKMAKILGKFDTVTAYKPEDIDKKFRENYSHILNIRAGNGLWLWKPYFLLKKLQEVDDNDIVFYGDAGSFFFRSYEKLISCMTDDIWVSNIPLIEKQFTKPELFELMNCNGVCYTETNQMQANFLAIRKTERGVQFVKEWLRICCLDGALNQESVRANSLDYKFFGHRSDQSVLSILVKKWKIMPHLDPSQYGRVPEKYYALERIYKATDNYGEYKSCIILHRGRRIKISTCLNQWLCTWLPLSVIRIISKPCRQIKQSGGR